MRKPSRRVAHLAARLLQAPAGDETATPESPVDAFQRRYDAVRPRLTELVGRVGFRALLARALALAAGERSWFNAVQVDDEGALTGLPAALAAQDPAEAEAGCVALLAHFLALLAALIGSELTALLLCDPWPDVPMDEADFATDEGKG